MRIVGSAIVLGTVLMALAPLSAARAAEPEAVAPAATQEGTTSADAGAAAAAAEPVARVNGLAISRAEFTRNWEYFLQRSGIPRDHAEKSGKVTEFRKQVLDRLVDEELLFQEARNTRKDATREQVDAELEKARQQFPTPEAFTEALARNRLSEEGLRAVFTRNLSIQSLVEGEIAKTVAVSDAEVHDFYAGNQGTFEIPEQIRARHVLIEVDAKADDATRQAAKAKAEDLLGKLKGGADFEAFAREHSDCPSAPEGGDLGFFRRGQMVPEFDRAAFALKPGELSGVVETQFGYHIIRVEERKDGGTVPESEAAPQIREHLMSQKTEAAVEQRLKALREKAKIELLMQY